MVVTHTLCGISAGSFGTLPEMQHEIDLHALVQVLAQFVERYNAEQTRNRSQMAVIPWNFVKSSGLRVCG